MYIIFLYLFTSSTLINLCVSIKIVKENISYYPFNMNLYKDVLNRELCQQQVEYIRNNNTMLWARFLDAGIRIPRGIFTGNRKDMGNYYECLDIKHDLNEVDIQGKYCIMHVSLKEEMNSFNSRERTNIYNQSFHLIQDTTDEINELEIYNDQPGFVYDTILKTESISSNGTLPDLNLRLAICIPASCSPSEGIKGLLVNVSALGVNYEEEFCRLPNDKPWASADYVATVMFSIIGIMTFLSTSYDLHYRLILKKDKRNANPLLFCFSVYTNAKRLITFTSGPYSLECVDGIRALAMMWVILGHSFLMLLNYSNIINVLQFTISPRSIWLTSAHLTVDTFFFLSGMLVVYTTLDKITGEELLRGLHIFYLHRLLRIFPLLAAMTLFEASFYNYVADGPFWEGAALGSLRCRQYWWSTLLHIQNFVNPLNLCLGVSWYLSVDVQLHFISPIILFWVLSPRKQFAWAALTTGLVIALTASTLFIYYFEYPSGPLPPTFTESIGHYFKYYYMNLLTRAPPFFVGMIFGYILHIWRGKKLNINKIFVLIFWCCSLVLLGSSIYSIYINLKLYWTTHVENKFINSFTRSLWAAGLGGVIFACVKGYGGPINWFLSLQMWKLPARLSYAMFIIHFSIIVAYYQSALEPTYFTVPKMMFNFFSFLLLTFVISFVATIIIDSPFTTIIKMLINVMTR